MQGDTGPGNFMFEGDRVTHLVDWEIAHFGDPMEDLAAICVRDMVTPFAHLPTLFARYGEVSGTDVDLDRVRYHRVSKCVRSLFAILSFTSQPSDAPEFAIWQAWRLLYIKSACQALAEAMGGGGLRRGRSRCTATRTDRSSELDRRWVRWPTARSRRSRRIEDRSRGP